MIMYSGLTYNDVLIKCISAAYLNKDLLYNAFLRIVYFCVGLTSS